MTDNAQDTPVCRGFTEHPGWEKQHPTGPVTWDAWCSRCGFRLEDRPFADGLTIEGNGRKLALVSKWWYVSGERYVYDKRTMLCSVCCPGIPGNP